MQVSVGVDRVIINQFADIKNAKRVHIVPFKDCLEEFSGDVFETFLKPYFFENYRPVHSGEVRSLSFQAGESRAIVKGVGFRG